MRHISDNIKRTLEKSRKTERGELLQYFRQRLNMDRNKDGYPPISMPRMGSMLTRIPTKDLYYLKKVCDDAKHFSKKFWWELNPKNHTEEAIEKSAKKPKRKRH